MNMTATQPLTTIAHLTEGQPSTNMPWASTLEPLDTSTIPPFTELLSAYNASIHKPEIVWNRLTGDELDQLASSNVHQESIHTVAADLASANGTASAPGTASASALPSTSGPIDQTNLADDSSQPTRWFWSQRISLASLNLLDGDHGTGRSLLAHQIAASVSSGSPMPDGSKTIQGGVVIIRLYSASGIGSHGSSRRRKLCKAQPISTNISRNPDTVSRQMSLRIRRRLTLLLTCSI